MLDKTHDESMAITDVQQSIDTRQIAIDKVGIKDIRHPICVLERGGGQQHTIANCSFYVDLAKQFKGTHMSRFVDILNRQDQVISIHSFKGILHQVTQQLQSHSAYVEMHFPYFIKKAAPVSLVESLMDYEASLIGAKIHDQTRITLKVKVPVTSLCPCSKKISDYGAHNQRSHVSVAIHTDDEVAIEDVIDLVESEASCELYGLLKRPDEKHVTEQAYDNPKFVEDMVRDVATHLDRDSRVLAYCVESENFESIHNHSAYAMVKRDKGN